MIRFTRGHCVICCLVRQRVAGSCLITRVQVLLFGLMSRLFIEIAISARLHAAWKVSVLFLPITRIATWGCVGCTSARDRATGIWTRSMQYGCCVRVHRFRKACSFARLRDANSFLPFQGTSRALTHQVVLRLGISDSGYEMINGETQLVVGREIGVRARAQVGNSSSVRDHRFPSELSETLQRISISAVEFEASEERDQAFTEHRIILDMIRNMGPSFLGFSTSELCENKEAPAIAGSIVKG